MNRKPAKNSVRLRSRKEVGSARETRSKVVEAARLELLKNPRALVERQIKGQERTDRFNREEAPQPYQRIVIAASEAARSSDRLLMADEIAEIRRRGSAGVPKDLGTPKFDPDNLPFVPPEFWKEWAWYDELHRMVDVQIGGGSCTSEVDLDEVSPTTIRPNRTVTLNGTCFGDTRGAVLLRILPDPVPNDFTYPNIVELQIETWSATAIGAYLPSDFNGFAQSDSLIWVRTADNHHSNAMPIVFVPRTWIWLIQKDVKAFGGWFGASLNGWTLQGSSVGDQRFEIVHVGSSHSGSGWSELTSPTAGGQNLWQGYHIGVPAGKHGTMTIHYTLHGPAGMTPPEPSAGTSDWGASSNPGPWGFVGEVT